MSLSYGSANRSGRDGFTIIEVMIALIILSVGMVVMAGLMTGSARLQLLSISRTEMITAAENKVEELRSYAIAPRTSPTRLRVAVGGSLDVAIAGYADSTQSMSGRWYHRRWQIVNGTAGIPQATVRVVPSGSQYYVVRSLDFSSLLALNVDRF